MLNNKGIVSIARSSADGVSPERRRFPMKILKSSEDYLEAMLIMKEVHGYIRSIDIAMELGVTKPSVSYATKRLRENGYITMDKDGFITLTDKGMAIAVHIYERHKVLTSVLIQLGVNPETAREDACKLEHDISDESFDALKRHLEKNGEQSKV